MIKNLQFMKTSHALWLVPKFNFKRDTGYAFEIKQNISYIRLVIQFEKEIGCSLVALVTFYHRTIECKD
jgi:hypothetical protein